MPARDFYHDVVVLDRRRMDDYARSFGPAMAIPRKIVEDLFQEPIGQLLLKRERVRLLVFDPDSEVIVEWIRH
jgi:hypothetical protein